MEEKLPPPHEGQFNQPSSQEAAPVEDPTCKLANDFADSLAHFIRSKGSIREKKLLRMLQRQWNDLNTLSNERDALKQELRTFGDIKVAVNSYRSAYAGAPESPANHKKRDVLEAFGRHVFELMGVPV